MRSEMPHNRARRSQTKSSHGLEDFRNGDRPDDTPAALNFFGTVDFIPSLELHCRSLAKRVIVTSNQSREPAPPAWNASKWSGSQAFGTQCPDDLSSSGKKVPMSCSGRACVVGRRPMRCRASREVTLVVSLSQLWMQHGQKRRTRPR